MKYGLTDSQWGILEDLLIRPLQKNKAQVWIFGSRARGDHRQYSDIDILFSSSAQPLPRGLISDIKEKLEDSRLLIKVDLVEDVDLAESYRPSIEKDKIALG